MHSSTPSRSAGCGYHTGPRPPLGAFAILFAGNAGELQSPLVARKVAGTLRAPFAGKRDFRQFCGRHDGARLLLRSSPGRQRSILEGGSQPIYTGSFLHPGERPAAASRADGTGAWEQPATHSDRPSRQAGGPETNFSSARSNPFGQSDVERHVSLYLSRDNRGYECNPR